MIELIIDSKRKDLGGFEVGRILPFAKHRMVGPLQRQRTIHAVPCRL